MNNTRAGLFFSPITPASRAQKMPRCALEASEYDEDPAKFTQWKKKTKKNLCYDTVQAREKGKEGEEIRVRERGKT